MARDKKSGGFVSGHDEGIGKGDFANMPKEVMMKEYPKYRSGVGGELDDTMSDIDMLASRSESDVKRHLSDQK